MSMKGIKAAEHKLRDYKSWTEPRVVVHISIFSFANLQSLVTSPPNHNT